MDDEQDFDQDFEQGMQGGVGEAAYYETENENWFSRLGNALAGVCIGLLLFVGAFPVLWWNEGRAVDRYNALDSARDLYVPITSESIDAANEGKLVYINGLVLPTENITDVDFGVETMNKIKLNRNVEVYQWKENKQTEKRKTLGGGTETITKYTYAKTWSTSLIDSTRFKEPERNNPTSMPYTAQGFYADLIIGEFSFPNDLVERMATYSPLYQSYNVTTLPSYNPLAQSMNELADNTGFYFSTRNPPNTANALIGDTRVSYQTAEGGQVSMLAQQSGKTFVPWIDKDTQTSIYRLERGTVTPEVMITNAEAENKVLTWILRVVGIGMMSGGIGLVLSPLEVAADIIPCIGDLVGGAITLVSTLIGVIISFVVIGIAWVANRPVLLYSALGGLVVIGGLVYLGVRRKNTNQNLAQGHGQGPTTVDNFSNNQVIVPVVPGQSEEPDIAYKPY